jgi:hypothetical protein
MYTRLQKQTPKGGASLQHLGDPTYRVKGQILNKTTVNLSQVWEGGGAS